MVVLAHLLHVHAVLQGDLLRAKLLRPCVDPEFGDVAAVDLDPLLGQRLERLIRGGGLHGGGLRHGPGLLHGPGLIHDLLHGGGLHDLHGRDLRLPHQCGKRRLAPVPAL